VKRKGEKESQRERDYLLSSDLLLAAGPKTESEPESSNREREKEKSCRKIMKEEGESFGENFLVFRFVFFSTFLGYKP
jgi:hypothetical protein